MARPVPLKADPLLFDFSQPETVEDWVQLNDVVMGGRSSGGLSPSSDGTALFHGRVSFENGGGFASIRSKPRPEDLGGYAGVSVRVRGDGRRYKLNFKTDESGVLYRAEFETRVGSWQDVSLPFEAFQPTLRGRLVPEAPVLDRSRILSVGLMISDGQDGPFRLEIAWIRLFGPS